MSDRRVGKEESGCRTTKTRTERGGLVGQNERGEEVEAEDHREVAPKGGKQQDEGLRRMEGRDCWKEGGSRVVLPGRQSTAAPTLSQSKLEQTVCITRNIL